MANDNTIPSARAERKGKKQSLSLFTSVLQSSVYAFVPFFGQIQPEVRQQRTPAMQSTRVRLLVHRVEKRIRRIYSYYMQIKIRIIYYVAYRLKKIKILTTLCQQDFGSEAILIHGQCICKFIEVSESNSATSH